MNTFDEARLDPSRYDIDKIVEAVDFQKTVRDFMEIVRANPSYLLDKSHLVEAFTSLIDRDKYFSLAAIIAPELRLPQTHDAAEDTPMNLILRKVKNRRPPPPSRDPTHNDEQLLVARNLRNQIEYLTYGLRGYGDSTPEDREEAERLIATATALVCKLHDTSSIE